MFFKNNLYFTWFLGSNLGWFPIGSVNIPYILRNINGQQFKLVSVRMVEITFQLYLDIFPSELYSLPNVKGYFITEAEAQLLSEVTQKLSDKIFSVLVFQPDRDLLVRLEDVQEFSNFTELCYKLLTNEPIPDNRKRFGFVKLNHEIDMAYCILNGEMYFPLFLFDSHIERLYDRALTIDNWDWVYLKIGLTFCKIENNSLLYHCCLVVKLEDLKTCFPPETFHVQYLELVVTSSTYRNNNSRVGRSASWVKAPLPLHRTRPSRGIFAESTEVIYYNSEWTYGQASCILLVCIIYFCLFGLRLLSK